MAHFNDAILPITIRLGSSTFSDLAAQHLVASSGYRKSNELWDEPLRTFRLQYKRPIVDGIILTQFWEALGFDSFLIRDWTFWHTASSEDSRPNGNAGILPTDAPLINPNTNTNIADGSTTVFQTWVTRTAGSASRSYRIRHPVASTVRVAVDGVEDVSPATFSVNEETGEVTFDSPPPFGASPTGAVLTWGGEFRRAAHFIEGVEEIMNNFEVNGFGLVLREAKGV